MEIGEQVKQCRKEKKLTIKKMSELTGLSTGFISQFERGITTIDVEHLENIAKILDKDITSFFSKKAISTEQKSVITRSYERPYTKNLNQSIHFNLQYTKEQMTMSPEYIEILPFETKQMPNTYQHEGEEFVFVLEGILTFYFENEVIKLYPGDSAHFPSHYLHNWTNLTDSITKMVVVHAPLKTNE